MPVNVSELDVSSAMLPFFLQNDHRELSRIYVAGYILDL